MSGDILPRKKPDPMPITYACGFFAARPDRVLLIGDSGNDARGGARSRLPVFCVTYGYNAGGDVRSLGFDAIVDSLEEAVALIQKF